MFSAYELDPTHGWVGVHRLPFEDAIKFCKHYREQKNGRPVAVVPDGADPSPYLRVALGLPHYGSANPDVQILA